MANDYQIAEATSSSAKSAHDNTSPLSTVLKDAENLLSGLGDEFASERNHICELEKRLSSARFHLAVLGQFKRGKSTLLNALLGEELLPSAVVPLTSVPTFLFWGASHIVRVVFLDGNVHDLVPESAEDTREILSRYVTEGCNSKNHLGVAHVEVACSSPLLQKGVVLIDTPGIGSTFQHNTEATVNFLPQCDAALFLVSADPPITQVEIEFLKAVKEKVVKTFFLMNKVDYLSEKERQVAVEFLKKVLQDQAGLDSSEPIFSISARRGLEAKLKGDDNQLSESGFSKLENSLVEFLNREKIQTLNLAIARKAGDIIGEGLLQIRLKQRSLTLPLEDLEQRLATFNQKIKEIEQQRELAHDLLAGDQKRLVEKLEQECAASLQANRDELARILTEALESAPSADMLEKTVSGRLVEIVPDLFGASLSRISGLVNQRMQDILGSHQEKANALAETIRRTAAELFEIPYAPGKGEERIVTTSKPYWVTENWSATMSPIPRGALDRVLPRSMVVSRVRKWLQQDIEAITLRNIENLRWATIQNMDKTFRRFSIELDEHLEEVAKATLGAIQEAHTRRTQQADSVDIEIKRLRDFESRLQDILDRLSAISL
ncbi:MAG: dynamin family protein [Dehalococcoidia bacterium]